MIKTIRGEKVEFEDDNDDNRVWFYENGQVEMGVLKVNQTIGDVSYRDFYISFHEDGQVRSGRLNGDQTIQEVDFKDGDFVVFDEDGVLEK